MNGLISLLLILCVFYDGLVEGVNNEQPNIIIIIADDLGWNDVGFHGADDVQTPNIDALAFYGVSLYRHYSLPTCTPSRAALLTGRYPIRTGIHEPFGMGTTDGIPLNETLLPQYLKTLGYQTHLVGKWHLGYSSKEYTPTYRGFDSHFGYYSGYIGYYDGIHISPRKIAGLDMRRNGKPAWSDIAGDYATQIFTKEAIKIIEEHDQTSPLFLEVAHLAPHAGNTNGRLQVSDITENEKTFGYIKDHNRRLFAGMVKELDESVGNIITALDKNDLLDNSIIVFISDNGAPSYEPLWHTTNYGSNWPLRGEKCSLHEGGVRTVGAVWSPKLMKPSSVYRNVVHITDWLPTLVTAAGGDISNLNNIDGINQWEKIINNIDNTEKGEQLEKDNRTVLLDIYDNEALISGKWKIIKNNPHSSLSFANDYYGSTKDSGTPDYNLTAVKTSPAANSLNKIIKLEANLNMNQEENDEAFLQLRLSNQIKCNNIDVKLVGNCSDDYCLYNLEDDPCEKINLNHRQQKKLNELVTKLNDYKKTAVQVVPKKFDMNSHPKYWDNYWSCWINLTNDTNIANRLDLNQISYVALFLFLYAYSRL